MEKVRIGINGFGRIGRLAMRIAEERDDVEVMAVNDPQPDADYMAYLLEYDSVHGRFAKPCRAEGSTLIVGERRVETFACRSPGQIPWAETGAEYILESTGLFTTVEKASAHLGAGAKKCEETAHKYY